MVTNPFIQTLINQHWVIVYHKLNGPEETWMLLNYQNILAAVFFILLPTCYLLLKPNGDDSKIEKRKMICIIIVLLAFQYLYVNAYRYSTDPYSKDVHMANHYLEYKHLSLSPNAFVIASIFGALMLFSSLCIKAKGKIGGIYRALIMVPVIVIAMPFLYRMCFVFAKYALEYFPQIHNGNY
jgi:hypothetical protein